MINKRYYCYIKHGLSNHKLHSVWDDMKSRCYNKSHKNYKHYGKRGIKICNEWFHNFKSFYDWSIASGWENSVQIDRIDVNGNYEPNNCRWVTKQQNLFNKRPTGKSKYKGVSFVSKNKWRARICINNKRQHIGYFKNEEEAAYAYDLKAKELFEEFAYLNFSNK